MNKLTKEYKAKWNKEWISKNRERYNASKYHYRERTKIQVLSHYSNGELKFKHCGYTDIRALCLDHIKHNGSKDRKQNKIASRGSKGMNSYESYKKLGYPDGLQVLCFNCNTIKEWERKKDHRLKNKFYKPLI